MSSREQIIQKSHDTEGFLHIDEMNAIYDCAEETATKGGKLAEIGSYYGKSAVIIGGVCANKGAELICIDTFSLDIHYAKKELHHPIYSKFRENVAGLPVSWILKLSSEAHKEIKDGSLDMCFIDGNHHFPVVQDDIDNYLPKIRKGGILCGHDYNNPCDVKEAVDKTFGVNNIETRGSVWIYRVK